ncbi:hypothetical protein RAS12_30645 (plasmid) [Achromobacter seleniivolatilans]|uniref:Uncharacterized protein n=1 Tax=Achromobacter seleniivolatilans TaxID=3047478 RepID=A0ABY9MAH9_9BURK|nr:hypothetical protein [Achromobacter sp. R39]WMD23994.1 hypothetical protein RAS12_30645 [Achromobacter sp. R39]
MAIEEIVSGMGSRTRAFLQRAVEGGHEIRVEGNGAVVRDPYALGRRLAVLGLAAAVASVAGHEAQDAAPELAPPKVSINGNQVKLDPFLARLLHPEPAETIIDGDMQSQSKELIQELARCSPGLAALDPTLLLNAYRYTMGWQSSTSAEMAGELRQLAQNYAELSIWAADSGRSVELAIAAFCQQGQDWRSQLAAWDETAARDAEPRGVYRDVVLEYRARVYSNVIQAQWEYQANANLAGSLADQGLQVKIRGDYRGWVSAIGSVAQGVAEAAGGPQTRAVVRGVTGLASSSASAARGMERVTEVQGAQRRVDLAGRSISEIARLGRSADRLLEGASKARGTPKKQEPTLRAPVASSRAPSALSMDVKSIGAVSEAAKRMGFHVSLSPLTGEPLPKDHSTVTATLNPDSGIARQAAQRNLAEVATLHEFSRAAGLRIDFDLMYSEYAQLADAIVERERQRGRYATPANGSRGG